ncbi:unnamed protein product [Clonostachys rhizophaga]|uniref:Heterokaryon incompatibility domain-containing protein n=1 Tax=Clonostachys rhizophaga TaxID=160324 RepID=A0A9N9VG85_9HYPO|nr:unnamed protein product [Clonostachys rhizophaga]
MSAPKATSKLTPTSQWSGRMCDYPLPEHPPGSGPRLEQWTGWEAWDRYCDVRQQADWLRLLIDILMPLLDAYYSQDKNHPGFIEIAKVDFPNPPDLENYNYDETHEYLKECYSKILDIALPDKVHKSEKGPRTRQTTLGNYLSLYQPLQVSTSASTIRLLELCPAFAEDDTIRMRLFTAELDKTTAGDYEALSYAWEEPSASGQKESVYVNGFKIKVTSNLFSALSSLRKPSTSRLLWIDSICINQADVRERQHQVQLMARIYTGAKRVIVYLGPSTPATNTVLRVLQSPASQTFPENGDSPELDLNFSRLCHDAETELIEGFIDITSRSWWSRVWVLQEYILHKKEPLIYCGRLHVSNRTFSQNFSRLFSWVEHRRRHPTTLKGCTGEACKIAHLSSSSNDTLTPAAQKAEENDLSQNENHEQKLDLKLGRDAMFPARSSIGREWTKWARQVWKVRQVLRGRQICGAISSGRLVVVGRDSRSTSPHDIVYGLRELRDPLFRSIFPPDYMMPLSMLFTRYAAFMIIVYRHIDMFWYYPYRLRDRTSDGQTTLGASFQDIPSWVPDFTRPRSYRCEEGHPQQLKRKNEEWNSTARIFNHTLLMNGLLLDEIVDVFPLPSNDPFLLLQQLWYVERKFWDPEYLREKPPEHKEEDGLSKGIFHKMLDHLGGVLTLPSVAWSASNPDPMTDSVSVVDVLEGVMILRSVVDEEYLSFREKIPQVADIILANEGSKTSSIYGREAAGTTAHLSSELGDLSLNEENIIPKSKDERQMLINKIEYRLLDLLTFLDEEHRWTDFVGICIFDYDNFRSQVIHRLSMWSAQRLGDLFGGKPGFEHLLQDPGPRENTARWAVTHRPFYYTEYIDAIDNNHHPMEIRMREAFIVGLATRIHKVMANMVGLEGTKTFESFDTGDVRKDLPDAKNGRSPLIFLSPILESSETDKNQHHASDATDDEFQSLDFPHRRGDHPHGKLMRWWSHPREKKYDVHPVMFDVVQYLAGRELFVTETGLSGITTVGTTGLRDGDDLLLIEGMSHLLIGRLEPSNELGNPKKRRREMSTIWMKREILGTAVAKGIDTKEGDVDEAICPPWFEDITHGKRGLFRFS